MAFGPTPEDLAELKCFVLESMRDTLVRNVDPTKFLPFLRSKFVLSGRESDTIKSCCSKSVYDGADKLIDVLCTKGAKGYDVFCDAIVHDKTQVFLLTDLNKRLEMVKHAKKEQEIAHAEQVRQHQKRIMLEQTCLREQVHPYHPRPSTGDTSAHTTTCLNHIPPAPRAQMGMSSRSPIDQQYSGTAIPQYTEQVGMPSPSPNQQYSGTVIPEQVGMSSPSPSQQYSGTAIPEQVGMPSRSPNQQYSGTAIPQYTEQVGMSSPSPNQQYSGTAIPQQYTNTEYGKPTEWNRVETTLDECNPCGQSFGHQTQ